MLAMNTTIAKAKAIVPPTEHIGLLYERMLLFVYNRGKSAGERAEIYNELQTLTAC